jgi:hypothetical protein
METSKLTRSEDWKHCMDAHVHRIGLTHDSRRWVRTDPTPDHKYNI